MEHYNIDNVHNNNDNHHNNYIFPSNGIDD